MDKEKKPLPAREILSDCLMVAGALAISVGVGLIYLAAGAIVAGAWCMAFGWLIGRGGDSR